MQLGFLRGGGKFHVRGEQRELRAAPVGAHPATNVDAHAAPVAGAVARTEPETVVAAVARTDTVADTAADPGANAGAR